MSYKPTATVAVAVSVRELRLRMAEFTGCAAVACSFFAFVALLFGLRDEAPSLAVLAAVAVAAALVRRGWWNE